MKVMKREEDKEEEGREEKRKVSMRNVFTSS